MAAIVHWKESEILEASLGQSLSDEFHLEDNDGIEASVDDWCQIHGRTGQPGRIPKFRHGAKLPKRFAQKYGRLGDLVVGMTAKCKFHVAIRSHIARSASLPCGEYTAP